MGVLGIGYRVCGIWYGGMVGMVVLGIRYVEYGIWNRGGG